MVQKRKNNKERGEEEEYLRRRSKKMEQGYYDKFHKYLFLNEYQNLHTLGLDLKQERKFSREREGVLKGKKGTEVENGDGKWGGGGMGAGWMN